MVEPLGRSLGRMASPRPTMSSALHSIPDTTGLSTGFAYCQSLSATRSSVRVFEWKDKRWLRDDAWRLHRIHAAYSVPASCPLVLFPENTTPERERTSAAFLERAECVIEDLDARAALREAAGI